MNKQRLKTAWSLFRYFFHISWFTFGGGWSIVAQMQKDYVETEGVLTSEELLDIVSVGRSIPGTMIGNVAYLFGHRQGGTLGGLAALIGMVTPPMLILSVLTFGYSRFQNNPYVARLLSGVRSAVVPIILAAALKLGKTALTDWFSILLCIVACLLNAFLDINCVVLILGGLVIGLIAGKVRRGQA